MFFNLHILIITTIIAFTFSVCDAAVINIEITDPDGQGFNDTTPVAPVGGNTGTTLGQQRLNVFKAAARFYEGKIDSSVPITITGSFSPMICTPTFATAGMANKSLTADFVNAPLQNTWYPTSLANAYAGYDIFPSEDMSIKLNSLIGDAGCLGGANWWNGLSGTATLDIYDNQVILYDVILHEIAHGLGFGTSVDEQGELLGGFQDAFMQHLKDLSVGKLWSDMTDAERQASSLNDGNLVWVGPMVTQNANAISMSSGLNNGYVKVYAGSEYGGQQADHWDLTLSPDEIMEAVIHLVEKSPPISNLTINALYDIGWKDTSVLGSGDLDLDIRSEHELFRPDKNNDFTVTVENLGDTIVSNAEVTIHHDMGFNPSWRGWQCAQSADIFYGCTKLSQEKDETGTTAKFRVSIGVDSAGPIKGYGEFDRDSSSVTVTATVSGGTPADTDASNSSDTLTIEAFPSTDLLPPRRARLCTGSGICDDNGPLSIDINKPTIVLTHGIQGANCDQNDLWTGFDNSLPGAGYLLNEFFTADEVNVLQYHWEGACHPGGAASGAAYIKGRQNAYPAGEELANKLKQNLGTDYAQKIQFVGHSMGTAVNAYASRIFLEEVTGIPEAQVTILDYPNRDRITKVGIPLFADLSNNDAALYGFDRDFFAEVLPFGCCTSPLKVDNYYASKQTFDSTSTFGVGTDITAPIDIYNHYTNNPGAAGVLLFNESIWGGDHSGVHQWYRWTMRPVEEYGLPVTGTSVCPDSSWNLKPSLPNIPPLSPSLNPCEYGWHISTMQLPYSSVLMPITQTDRNRDSETVDTEFTGGTGTNCTLTVEAGSIVCAEASSSTLSAQSMFRAEAATSTETAAVVTPPIVSYLDATMMVPANARYLTFDYRFTNIGDGDYVYVMVDDKPLWQMTGEVLTENEWRSSGPISIALEGGENTFIVALYGVGTQNAQIELQNFQFIEVASTFLDVPPAHTAYGSVESLVDTSVVQGCDATNENFCPEQVMTRDTLAVWLMKALKGDTYIPPVASGTVFDDVPVTYPFAAWIEAFYFEGITEGCGTNLYCPNAPVDKAQLAKMLLITKEGTSYTPDLATGTLFDDVGIYDYNADWIEAAAQKGLLEGCDYRTFCPGEILNRSSLTRKVESVF